MRVLAIDPGTKCGFAVWQDGTPLLSGVINLTPRKGDHIGRRYAKALDTFLGLIMEHRVNVIAFEDVKRHKGTIAAHVYGGLVAVLFIAANRFNLPVHPFSVSEIKQRATGKGGGKGADKAAMIEATVERLGITPVDDNQADALWLGVVCIEALTKVHVQDRAQSALFEAAS